MEAFTRKRTGRPPGREYPVIRQVRLKTEDVRDLQELAAYWRCTEAEALRRAVRERAEQERKRARRREPDPVEEEGYRLHSGIGPPWPEDE